MNDSVTIMRQQDEAMREALRREAVESARVERCRAHGECPVCNGAGLAVDRDAHYTHRCGECGGSGAAR